MVHVLEYGIHTLALYMSLNLYMYMFKDEHYAVTLFYAYSDCFMLIY